MDRLPLEVADLVRAAGTAFIERNRQWIRWTHIKVLLAIARCRTAALGVHLDEPYKSGCQGKTLPLPRRGRWMLWLASSPSHFWRGCGFAAYSGLTKPVRGFYLTVS